METRITIDGREIPFRATAAVPRLYRIKFRRDILQDMAAIQRALKDAGAEGTALPAEALELFENAAYIMAKHAGQGEVPDTPEAWLDGFETFSIYEIFPRLLELWNLNLETAAKPKKK